MSFHCPLCTDHTSRMILVCTVLFCFFVFQHRLKEINIHPISDVTQGWACRSERFALADRNLNVTVPCESVIRYPLVCTSTFWYLTVPTCLYSHMSHKLNHEYITNVQSHIGQYVHVNTLYSIFNSSIVCPGMSWYVLVQSSYCQCCSPCLGIMEEYFGGKACYSTSRLKPCTGF